MTNLNPHNKSTSLRALTDLFSQNDGDKLYWIWSADKLYQLSSQVTHMKISLNSLSRQDLVGKCSKEKSFVGL